MERRHMSLDWRVNDAASSYILYATHRLSLSPLHTVIPLVSKVPGDQSFFNGKGVFVALQSKVYSIAAFSVHTLLRRSYRVP